MRSCLRATVVLGCLVGLDTGAAAAGSSAGCGRPPPDRPPERFQVAGRERQAIVVVPDGYRADRGHPLVFGFHGRTSTNADARGYFGLEVATGAPVIFVYPAGLRDADGRFTWADPGDTPESLRDLALFDRILDRVAATYCIDASAVFVVGHSLGATFANSLACVRGERIRGLASVAGGIAGSSCAGAPAALLLHNPADRAVPLREGQRARDALLGRRDGDALAVNLDFGGFACQRTGERPPLLWCTHDQDRTTRGRRYPHRWPDGAAGAIMAFFQELLRPPGQAPARAGSRGARAGDPAGPGAQGVDGARAAGAAGRRAVGGRLRRARAVRGRAVQVVAGAAARGRAAAGGH